MTDWLIRATPNTWLSPPEVPTNRRTIEEVLQGLGIKAVFESLFTEPNRTVFTEELKTRCI